MEGGITPACAGKRATISALAAFLGDHPRLRGEKLLLHQPGQPSRGSPPLARGKVKTEVLADVNDGITPACAGKSLSFFLPACAEEDHPRLRGEKLCADADGGEQLGSPPLARGKVV